MDTFWNRRNKETEMLAARVSRMEMYNSELVKMLAEMNGKLDEILAGQKAAVPVAEPEEGPMEVDDGSQRTLERLARDVDDIKLLVARLCDTSTATDVKVITDVCDLLREIRDELKGRPVTTPFTYPQPPPTWVGPNTIMCSDGTGDPIRDIKEDGE